MVIAPHKNKSEVKTEQNAQRAANKARPPADTPAPPESQTVGTRRGLDTAHPVPTPAWRK